MIALIARSRASSHVLNIFGIDFARIGPQEGSLTARRRRFAPIGHAYHVGNRGNERRRIFHEDADYKVFLQLLIAGKEPYAVKVFGLCLMPNHVHAIIEPESEGALSAYVGWVSGGYASHLRGATDTVGYGHVFEGRFWNKGIEDSWHLLAVLRYIEANPVNAHLVRSAEEWPWSSFALRRQRRNRLLDPLPTTLPEPWLQYVNGIESLFDGDEMADS